MSKSPSWQKMLADRGWNNLYLNRTEYEAFQREEEGRMSAILKDLGMLAQQ